MVWRAECAATGRAVALKRQCDAFRNRTDSLRTLRGTRVKSHEVLKRSAGGFIW